MPSWLPWVRWGRDRIRNQPEPEAWDWILRRNAPLVDRLDADERSRLVGLMHLFLDDKTIEGCGGLEVTEEMRVTIAAHACLLLIGLEVDLPYPELDVIRLYPGAYRVSVTEWDGSVAVEAESQRLGESSHRGYVVLAWDSVRRGARDPADGENVVIHEFAHQLDQQSGASNGAPILPERGMYTPWARVLGRAYEALQEDVARQRRTVIDDYGATNPAEFFAVVSELFFERPRRLEREHPELYEILARYYGQRPK